jgi:hypothetical protein
MGEMGRRFKSNFSHGQLEEGRNWSGRKKEYGNSENNRNLLFSIKKLSLNQLPAF